MTNTANSTWNWTMHDAAASSTWNWNWTARRSSTWNGPSPHARCELHGLELGLSASAPTLTNSAV